jgi:hypothetical protein
MSNAFPSFLDGPQVGNPGQISRQAPSPSQNASHANGMNGAGGTNMNVFPAGQPVDLNLLWAQVQELSAQLEDNRKQTRSILSKIGQLRERAKNGTLTMSQILEAVNGDLNSACTYGILFIALTNFSPPSLK